MRRAMLRAGAAACGGIAAGACLVVGSVSASAAPLGIAQCIGPQPDGSVFPGQSAACYIQAAAAPQPGAGLRVAVGTPSGASVTQCLQAEGRATASLEFGTQCLFVVTQPGPGFDFGPMLIMIPASARSGDALGLLATQCVSAGCGGGTPLTISGPAARIGGSGGTSVQAAELLLCTGVGLRGEALAGTTVTCDVIAGQGVTNQSNLAVQSGPSAQVVGCTSDIGGVPAHPPIPGFSGCRFTFTASGAAPGTRVGTVQLSIPASITTGTPVEVIGFDCPFQGCGGGFPLAVVGGPGALVGVPPAIPASQSGPASQPAAGPAGDGSESIPHPSTISASLATPTQAFVSVGHTLVSVAIVVGLMLFITFPAALFNKTLEENYDDIRASLERRFGWLRTMAARLNRARGGGHLLTFALVLVVGAVLAGLLDPKFGFNRNSLITFGAVVLAILTGMTVPAVANLAYRRARGRPHHTALHALPFGLLVAAACVLVSRVSGFEPGYLYGVICGVAFTDSLARNETGHTVAIGTMATIAFAVIAWLIWLPVHAAAGVTGASALTVLAADYLGAVFAGGLVGAVLSQLPFRFLPGGALFGWHRGAWAATFGIALFGLVEVMLRPQTGHHPSDAPLVTTIVLFAIAGGLSVAFALYFQRRRRPVTAT